MANSQPVNGIRTKGNTKVVPLAAVAFKRVGIAIDVVFEIAAEEGIALVEEDRDARARRWPEKTNQPGQKKTACNHARQLPAETKNRPLTNEREKTATGPLVRKPRPSMA